MTAENPGWRRTVQIETPQWGETSFISFNVLDNIKLFGESGRPLKESPKYNPAQVPFEFVAALPDGGRKGKVRNRSAYHEIAEVHDDAFGLISYVRGSVLPYRKEVTPKGMLTVARAIQGLPYWLVMKSDNPMRNGEIPTYITSAAKVALGASRPYMKEAFADLGLEDSPERSSGPYRRSITPTHYVTDIFNRGDLISKRYDGGTVDITCPAPRSKIVELANILLDGPSEKKDEMGERLGLSESEMARVVAFGTAFHRVQVLDSILKEIMGDPTLDVEELSARAGKAYIPVELNSGRVVNIEDTFAKLPEIMVEMNEALGRQQKPPTIPVAFLRRK